MDNFESSLFRDSLANSLNRERRNIPEPKSIIPIPEQNSLEYLEAKESKNSYQSNEIFKKTADEIEQILISEDILRIKETGKFKLIEFRSGAMGVFKPPKRSDINHNRELASYLVSKELDFNFVPPTVARTVEREEGSIQLLIPNPIDLTNQYDYNTQKKETTFDTFVRNRLNNNDILLLFLFDFLVKDPDRGCNIIYRDKLYAIDNEGTFGLDSKEKKVLFWADVLGKVPVNSLNLDTVKEFVESISKTKLDSLCLELEKFLQIDEIEEFRKRISILADMCKKISSTEELIEGILASDIFN